MAKNKGGRVIITLRCISCNNDTTGNEQRRSRKIDYTTTKNRRNTPDRLEVKKYCPNCNVHASFKEIK